MSQSTGADRGREWFEVIFTSHFDRVLGYALRRSDPETAREITSQTFLVAWRRRDAAAEPILPWLLVVARNVLAEHRRAQGRRRRLLEKVTGSRLFHGPAGDLSETVAERDLVLRAFLELSESDRETLRLVAWDGLTNAEAAVVAGCSPSTFAVRLTRARQRLESLMSDHDAPIASPHPTPLEAR